VANSRRRESRYTKEQIAAINKRRAEKRKEAKKNRGKWHWFLTLHVLGILSGIVSFAFLIHLVLIDWTHILLIILGFSVVGLFAQYSYFKKRNIVSEKLKLFTPLYVSYNVFGIGLLGLFSVLVLNQALSGNEIIQEKYKILGVDPEYKIYRWGSVVFIMEDDMFANDPEMRALPYKFYYRYEERPYIVYDFYEGFFGFKIIGEHRLVPKE